MTGGETVQIVRRNGQGTIGIDFRGIEPSANAVELFIVACAVEFVEGIITVLAIEDVGNKLEGPGGLYAKTHTVSPPCGF